MDFFKKIFSIVTQIPVIDIIKQYPFLFALGLAIFFGYIFNALVIYIVPPNNVDSLSTHMSRVAFWLQHGDYFPWETPRKWQVIYPVNAQLQMYWNVLFSRTDRFVGYVQYLAAICSAVAIAGISRINQASYKQSVFAGSIFLSLPFIVLQSTTTQNDLITCALFITSIYFFFYGMIEQKRSAFIITGITIGLAVGTKQTLFFLLPPYLILMLLSWLVFKKVRFSDLFHLGWVSILTFFLIGSQIFIINQIKYSNPLGPTETIKYQSTGIITSDNVVELTVLNTTRFMYQMADLSGLPDPLWGYGIKFKALVSKPIFSLLNIDVESPQGVYPGHEFSLLKRYPLQEDFAWCGPLGFIILLPLMLIELISGLRKKNLYRISISIFYVLYFLFLVVFRPGWDPYQGRYFMPIIALATPLTAFWIQDTKLSKRLSWIGSIIAISTLLSCLFLNPAKTITGGRSIWNMDRTQLLSIQNTYMIDSMILIENELPLDTILGIATTGSYYPDYMFFGADFSRKIIPVYPSDKIDDYQWIKYNNIEYILVFSGEGYPSTALPYLQLLTKTNVCKLYKVDHFYQE
ncbi:MAG: glycosyltransferase family 39 protein [Anaerolineaceae bacterium]|nr:glycosyltransferase family 39 protein [Anaerolineaceae bacterium]